MSLLIVIISKKLAIIITAGSMVVTHRKKHPVIRAEHIFYSCLSLGRCKMRVTKTGGLDTTYKDEYRFQYSIISGNVELKCF